ncbi:MAG: site-specific integrase [Proteobacteria bacterium]|nr:MAG: site-specific integrase [Pseudomonadota bacterium]
MAIKNDKSRPNHFVVSFCKRHPVTRMPVSLRRTGVKGLAEAKRVEQQLIIGVEDKLRRSIVPTWNDVVERYLEDGMIRGLQKSTQEDRKLILTAHTSLAWGSRLIDTITTADVFTLMESRLRGNQKAHQKYFLRNIRAVFQFAVDRGYISRNPTPTLKFKTSDKIKPGLTEGQVRTLLDHAKLVGAEWYPHWVLALYTGMRNGELYALQWDRINLDARTIRVDVSWNSRDGFKSTKSGDDRIVEIAPSLLPVLRELKLNSAGNSFVLPRNERWDRGRQAHDLRMFLMGLGLPQIRFHDLRATWATLLISKGIEPIKVMKMGGWKHIDTMMIYMRKAGVDIRGSTDCLDLHDHNAQPAEVIQLR